MLSRRSVIVSGGAIAAAAAAIGYGLWPRMDTYQAAVEEQRRALLPAAGLADLVRMGTLAANGHNTQPWLFRLDAARVTILPDLTRRTKVVDPDDHHLFVSLGCAAANIAAAAPAQGRMASVTLENGPEPSILIDLAAGPTDESPLYRAIPLRQSTRTAFDGQPVSLEDLRLLRMAAAEEGVEVEIFTEAADREAILEFVVAGNSAQIDDPAFVAELRDWIRFTPEQALSTRDGLFAATSGNPVAPAWLAKRLFSLFFTKDAENDKYRDHIRSSAGIAVFIGTREDPEHWIKVGKSFQRFALQATALGIRNAHINQPVEVPALRTEFARWLGMPDRRPDLVVRFGRGPVLPMSLRRMPEQVIVQT
jgi:hypothetical protein